MADHWKMISMFLFKSDERGLTIQDLTTFGGQVVPIEQENRTLLKALTGAEQPRSIASLLLILVSLLHLWVVLWLSKPVAPLKLAQPLMMEVSLVSSPGNQLTTALPSPSKPVEPNKPKKAPVKKLVKKKKQAKPKQAQLPKPVLAPQDFLPAPSLTESTVESANSTDDPPVLNASASGMQGETQPYSEASFNANYGFNPKPKYPAIARSRGWQGKVLLRVRVSAGGLSESVILHRSSGYDVLDESAVAAVQKWRFTPAKRGDTPVSSSVIVPIIFTLNY